MGKVVADKQAMIAGMDPQLDPETYFFATMAGPLPPQTTALATISEAEGLSVIVSMDQAQQLDLNTSLPMRRITLSVFSSLEGVGLTAAVAQALATEGIACNMVAGYHHDHAFVPANDADRAVSCLRACAKGAR